MPQRCEQNIGIAGIEGHIDASALGIFVEDLLPGLASIPRAENPALLVVGERVPERRDERYIRILRIHNQPPDGVRVAQARERPGLAGIDRLVNAVPANDVAADARFARPHVDHIRIGLGNSHRADRRGRIFRLVEKRFPVETAVGGLPHSSSHRAKIVDIILPHHARNRDDAPAAKWADQPVL